MAKVTFTNKDKTGTDGVVNKWRDIDANELKASINATIDGATEQTLTDGATINWDISLGQSAIVTLGGNRTIANPTNTVNGGFYVLQVIQDGTGSRTLSWGANFIWPSGTAPTLTTTAGKRDFFGFICSNGKLYGNTVLNFA